MSESNSRLWATAREEGRDIVRKRKRKLHYVANILVISDPSAPQNEGKVFKYDFGKKIFDKISDLMQPQFPGEGQLTLSTFGKEQTSNSRFESMKVTVTMISLNSNLPLHCLMVMRLDCRQ